MKCVPVYVPYSTLRLILDTLELCHYYLAQYLYYKMTYCKVQIDTVN